MLGFILMCFVAANDGMVAVLARRMKDVHFSVMMFWFATFGMTLTSITIIVRSILFRQLPTLLYYNTD